MTRRWRQFADRQYAILPADPTAIDLWRRTVQTRRVAVIPSKPTISQYLPWRALRHRRREHVDGMDFGRAARDKDKPHPLGHHGNPFRCGWVDPAAVSAEEGPCRRSPQMDRTGSNSAGGRTDGVGFLWWSCIRTGSARRVSVYRPSYLFMSRS